MAVETIPSLIERLHGRVFQLVGSHLIPRTGAASEDRPGGAFVYVVSSQVSGVEKRSNRVVDADHLGVPDGAGPVQPPRHRSQDIAGADVKGRGRHDVVETGSAHLHVLLIERSGGSIR